MATPMRSTDFRSIVEPILNEVFTAEYDIRKDEYKQFMQEDTGIARNYHEEPILYQLNAAPELPDGTPVQYDGGGTLYVQRYIYKIYGLAFALTKVLVEDGDHIRLGKIFAKGLADSMAETKETVCANLLNNAFTSVNVGADGQPLVSSAHPLAGSFTLSNQLSANANLSQTSVEQMLIQIRQAINNNGLRMKLKGEHLIVAPGNEFQAEVILKSVLRSGSADNDVNPIKSTGMLSGGAKVVTRLGSTRNWFIQTDAKDGLKLLNRRSLEKSMEGDFETDSMRYKATERYGVGWTDFRTIYGAAGI